MGCPSCHSLSRRAAALLEYQASGAARLRQSAAEAFTDWHASDLSRRLVLKCKEKTEADLALLRAARAFKLQHADFQRCRVDEMTMKQAQKTFRTPAGQLHFEWACFHSHMPMEQPLRWTARLLLRPSVRRMPTPAEPAWNLEGFSTLVKGALQPESHGPLATACDDPQGLSSLMAEVELASAAPDGSPSQRLSRDEQSWLISFLCGEPSDVAFDSISCTLDAHASAVGE